MQKVQSPRCSWQLYKVSEISNRVSNQQFPLSLLVKTPKNHLDWNHFQGFWWMHLRAPSEFTATHFPGEESQVSRTYCLESFSDYFVQLYYVRNITLRKTTWKLTGIKRTIKTTSSLDPQQFSDLFTEWCLFSFSYLLWLVMSSLYWYLDLFKLRYFLFLLTR